MNKEFLYNSPYVAKRIKYYAKEKNISLKDLLIACKLGSNTFSHMLHGRSMAFDSLARIADYLDCSVDYLLGRTDNPEVNR
ncbi:MAG: helix-turn-helix transcriptional regulator [Hungatella sp.]|nr:helix-turn-helix transcriptional regulator [Hungatella sp.]